MYIVLYDEQNVVLEVEDTDGFDVVKIEPNLEIESTWNITWETGALNGVSVSFIVLQDDPILAVGDDLPSEVMALDLSVSIKAQKTEVETLQERIEQMEVVLDFLMGL